MNEQPKDLENRIAALERRVKVGQFMGVVFAGLLGGLLGWTLSPQTWNNNDVEDHFWLRNSADAIMVEMAASSEGGGGQLSVNGPDRTPLFKVYPYEDDDLGVTVSVTRPNGSQPAVSLHGRSGGGEIIVYRGTGERVSLWGGGVGADGRPVSVVERLVQDVAELNGQDADTTE